MEIVRVRLPGGELKVKGRISKGGINNPFSRKIPFRTYVADHIMENYPFRLDSDEARAAGYTTIHWVIADSLCRSAGWTEMDRIKHMSTIVDMLGRRGNLQAALSYIEEFYERPVLRKFTSENGRNIERITLDPNDVEVDNADWRRIGRNAHISLNRFQEKGQFRHPKKLEAAKLRPSVKTYAKKVKEIDYDSYRDDEGKEIARIKRS
jgi:hypothetical protein